MESACCRKWQEQICTIFSLMTTGPCLWWRCWRWTRWWGWWWSRRGCWGWNQRPSPGERRKILQIQLLKSVYCCWSNIYLTWPPPTSTGRQCCTILLWRHCASLLVWRHRASLNQLLQVSSHMASRQDFTSQHLCSCLPDCSHRVDDFIEIRPNLAQFLQ